MSEACGDPFDLFVRSYERELRSFIAGMGLPLHAVDDLAQEVFIDYFVQADGRYDAEVAWLKGMARNQVREWFRRNGRQRRLYQRYAEQLAGCTSPLEQADGTDRILDQLVQCLERLPDEHYRLIERYYGEEEDAGAIADSIGRSAAALRTQIFRLREVLRKCLHQRLQEES